MEVRLNVSTSTQDYPTPSILMLSLQALRLIRATIQYNVLQTAVRRSNAKTGMRPSSRRTQAAG